MHSSVMPLIRPWQLTNRKACTCFPDNPCHATQWYISKYMHEMYTDLPNSYVRALSTMRRQLSDDLCNQIIGMRQAGSSHVDIARAFRITQGAICKILKRHRETGVAKPRPTSGRPKKTTVREDRYLVRLVHDGRTKPSSQTWMEWMRFTNVLVATCLVNHRLLNAGYLAKRPVRKLCCNYDTDGHDWHGPEVTWIGKLLSGNMRSSVMRPGSCCIAVMEESGCADRLTRHSLTSVYYQGCKLVVVESQCEAVSIAPANANSISSMETWSRSSTSVCWRPKCCHLLGDTSRPTLCTRTTTHLHTELDVFWNSSRMRTSSTWTCLPCRRIWIP